MNHFMRMGFFASLMVLTTACSRHVVVEPDMVASKNQADWFIVSPPTAAPAAPPPGATPPPPKDALPPPPPPPPATM